MKNFNNEISSIMMDSIISLGLVTDNKDKRFVKFIMRSDSLEGNLLKSWNTPPSGNSLINLTFENIRKLFDVLVEASEYDHWY